MKTASICAGVIGYSYALKFAMGGNEVWAQNRTEKSSDLAKERVRESLHSLVVNGVYTEEQEKEILERIHFTTSVEEAVKDAGFIQESSAEHYDVKHEIVKQIEEYAPEDTVIASSTSGLLVTEIAKYARHSQLIAHNRGFVEKQAGWIIKQDDFFVTQNYNHSTGYFSFSAPSTGHSKTPKTPLPTGLYLEIYFRGTFCQQAPELNKKISHFLTVNNFQPQSDIYILPIENHWLCPEPHDYINMLFFQVSAAEQSKQ